MTYLKRLIPADVRARLVDYGMITLLLAISIISSLFFVGTRLSNEFLEISNMLPP
jgi:Flp pilus assembly pilin Flp